MNTVALLIIDYQNWFFRYESRKHGLESAIHHTNELSQAFHYEQFPIIHIVTIHKADKSTWSQKMKDDNIAVMIEGTADIQEIAGLQTHPTDLFFTKIRHSAFIRTDFETYLRDRAIHHLIVTGAFIDGCVGQTVIDAYERDFRVTIAKDAVLGVEQTRSEMILHWLHEEFNATISSNDEILHMIHTVYHRAMT